MLGIDDATAIELAYLSELPDTKYGEAAHWTNTWLFAEHQGTTHSLTGEGSEDANLSTITRLMALNVNKREEFLLFGFLLHTLGDTYAHKNLDDPSQMYGEKIPGTNYTHEHAFGKRANGDKVENTPDLISVRYPSGDYIKLVEDLEDILSLKFKDGVNNIDFSVFHNLGQYAQDNNVSLIGIINYEVAKFKNENSFEILYQHGHDIVSENIPQLNDIQTHRQHIKNTINYMINVEGYTRDRIEVTKMYKTVSYTNWLGFERSKREYVGSKVTIK